MSYPLAKIIATKGWHPVFWRTRHHHLWSILGRQPVSCCNYIAHDKTLFPALGGTKIIGAYAAPAAICVQGYSRGTQHRTGRFCTHGTVLIMEMQRVVVVGGIDGVSQKWFIKRHIAVLIFGNAGCTNRICFAYSRGLACSHIETSCSQLLGS